MHSRALHISTIADNPHRYAFVTQPLGNGRQANIVHVPKRAGATQAMEANCAVPVVQGAQGDNVAVVSCPVPGAFVVDLSRPATDKASHRRHPVQMTGLLGEARLYAPMCDGIAHDLARPAFQSGVARREWNGIVQIIRKW